MSRKFIFYCLTIFLGSFLGLRAFGAELPFYIGDTIFRIAQKALLLDSGDLGGDTYLQFGNTLNERLSWDNAGTKFVFTDDANIQGNLDVDGVIYAGSSNNAITDASGQLQGAPLSSGKAGGQTLIGGTGTGENLTLQSTAHATKGKIIFGSSAYDEANNNIGIGTTTPTQGVDVYGKSLITRPNATITNVVNFDTSITVNDLFVVGSYLYVVGINQLKIYFHNDNDTYALLGSTSTGIDNPIKVFVSGKYAYVLNGGSGAVDIYDITNPGSISRKGTYAIGSASYDISVVGSILYVSEYLNQRIAVINANNPVSPIKITTISTISSNPYEIFAFGRYLYIAELGGKLEAMDIANPIAPVSAGSITEQPSPSGVYASGPYVAQGSHASASIALYDVSNPASITLKGTFSYAGIGGGQNPNIQISGRYLFVTTNGASTRKLYVVDIQNITSPTLIASYTLTINPTGVRVAGNRVYAFGGGGTIQVFNIQGGIEAASGLIHALEVGSVLVRNNINVSGNVQVGTALSVAQQLYAAGRLVAGDIASFLNGIEVKEGINATMGVATLSGGTVTVNTTKVTANSRIFLTNQNGAGPVGTPYVSARTAATSFTITSTNASDTSQVAWMIVEPL